MILRRRFVFRFSFGTGGNKKNREHHKKTVPVPKKQTDTGTERRFKIISKAESNRFYQVRSASIE